MCSPQKHLFNQLLCVMFKIGRPNVHSAVKFDSVLKKLILK